MCPIRPHWVAKTHIIRKIVGHLTLNGTGALVCGRYAATVLDMVNVNQQPPPSALIFISDWRDGSAARRRRRTDGRGRSEGAAGFPAGRANFAGPRWPNKAPPDAQLPPLLYRSPLLGPQLPLTTSRWSVPGPSGPGPPGRAIGARYMAPCYRRGLMT